MTKPHAMIVGAGIIGVSCAAFLQRAGFGVTLIDRLPPGEGCSFGNAGGIAFAEVVPAVHPRVLMKIPGWLVDPLGPLTIRWRYLPKALPWFLAVGRNAMPDRLHRIIEARAALSLRAVSDFETLLKVAGSHGLLHYRDALRLYDTEAQFAAEAEERRWKSAQGYEMTRIGGGEAREMEPAVSAHVQCGALHAGWYFVSDPERVVKSIAESIVRNGGEILRDEVVSIAMSEGRAVALELQSGKRHALDRLVIAAGAYSHLLAKQLGDRVPLEAERGYHLTIPNPGVAISRTITYARAPGGATPMDMGLRLAGSDEFAGLDAPPNWRRADQLHRLYRRVLPGLRDLDGSEARWMGRRPGTPDSLPVISAATKAANAWYAFGHGHMGLTWGPTTGRLLSELVAGTKSNTDLTPYRVNRF